MGPIYNVTTWLDNHPCSAPKPTCVDSVSMYGTINCIEHTKMCDALAGSYFLKENYAFTWNQEKRQTTGGNRIFQCCEKDAFIFSWPRKKPTIILKCTLCGPAGPFTSGAQGPSCRGRNGSWHRECHSTWGRKVDTKKLNLKSFWNMQLAGQAGLTGEGS